MSFDGIRRFEAVFWAYFARRLALVALLEQHVPREHLSYGMGTCFNSPLLRLQNEEQTQLL